MRKIQQLSAANDILDRIPADIVYSVKSAFSDIAVGLASPTTMSSTLLFHTGISLASSRAMIQREINTMLITSQVVFDCGSRTLENIILEVV